MQERVQLHAQQLGEHYDHVQIFVTTKVDGGEFSRSYEFGTGVLHARLGHIREWLLIQDEYAKEWARARQREEL